MLYNKIKVTFLVKISTLIDNVKVKDKYTVQLHLKEAYQPALAELAMPRPYVFVSPKDFKTAQQRWREII